MKRTMVVAILGAACAIWSAIPLRGAGAPGVLFLLVAASCVVAGALRLVLKGTVPPADGVPMSRWAALVDATDAALQRTPWETGAVMAVVAQEAVHGSRPWHTGLLAVATVCYLLAVHQAESPVPTNVFRHQARLLVMSVVLVGASTGMALAPPAKAGALSGWLEAMAAVAAMTAGALALPL